jgi:hypothetical protein
MLNAVMLSVVMLHVIMLNVILLSVITMNVVVPIWKHYMLYIMYAMDGQSGLFLMPSVGCSRNLPHIWML